MAYYIKSNNANSTVRDNPLYQDATTLNVAFGEGNNFPLAFPYLLTIWDKNNYPDPGNDIGMEIVRCTARIGDTLTIVRAQEGTSNIAHSQNETVAMLITAGHFNDPTYGYEAKINLNTVKETNATHTGEVTGATALTIASNAVTYDKIQNISATNKILGRETADAGIIEEISCTAAGRAILDDVDVEAQRTTLGVDVAGTDNSTDVTLIGTPDYITIDGQVITRNSIDLTNDISGILPDENGGTGQSTYTQGDILYASTVNTLAKLPKGSVSQVLTMGAEIPVWGEAGTPGVHASSHITGQTDPIQLADTDNDGLLSATKWNEIVANTAKETNVPTALNVGTVSNDTVAITSDGGADDVTLPAATVDTAGMLTTAKWAEIVANTVKVTNATHTGVLQEQQNSQLEQIKLMKST